MKVKLYGMALLLTLIFMPAIPRGDAIAPPQKIEIENFEPIKKVEAKKESKKSKIQPKVKTYAQGCERYRDLVNHYFGSQAYNAMRVMKGESGCNPNAVGDNYVIGGIYAPSCGLFQIRTLPGRPSCNWLKVPENNIKYAAGMQRTQGWSPWTVARNLGL